MFRLNPRFRILFQIALNYFIKGICKVLGIAQPQSTSAPQSDNGELFLPLSLSHQSLFAFLASSALRILNPAASNTLRCSFRFIWGKGFSFARCGSIHKKSCLRYHILRFPVSGEQVFSYRPTDCKKHLFLQQIYALRGSTRNIFPHRPMPIFASFNGIIPFDKYFDYWFGILPYTRNFHKIHYEALSSL